MTHFDNLEVILDEKVTRTGKVGNSGGFETSVHFPQHLRENAGE
jgi:hypothetical protein